MRARNMAWIGLSLLMFIVFVSGRKKMFGMLYHTPIGIDLGTTYSSIAMYRNDKVEIIANDRGNRVTPSCVSFTDTEVLVGEAAKDISHLNPERTISNVRRLLGRKFNDPDFQREMKTFPYKVINKGGKPHVEIKTKGGDIMVYSPEEISAMILQKMKETAEAYLGQEIIDAVITVPGCFGYYQTKAISHAASLAGLRVHGLSKEGVGASYSYGLEKVDDKNILVLDFGGGGTFDVTVFDVEDQIFEVLAMSCNTSLGGENLDPRVVDYFVQLIKKKYNKDISKEKKYLQELLKECEKAKIALSNQTQVLVEIDLLLDGIKFSEQLTRAKFEELNIAFFQEMVIMVKRGLLDAKLTMSDIHDIVFVGGSAHIPMVQQLFKDFFAGKEVARSIDPAEVMVHGAAINGEGHKRAICETMSLHWSSYMIPWPYCLLNGNISDAVLREIKDRADLDICGNDSCSTGLVVVE